MPGENEPINVTAPSEPASVEQAQPSASYSREQYESAIKAARDAAFAEARRTFEGKAPKKRERTEEAQTVDPADIVSRHMDLMDTLSELNLSSSQRRRIVDAFKRENPSEPGQWARDFVADLGLGQASKPAAAPETPKATNNPPAPHVPSAAPGSAVPTDRPEDVLSWDEDMVHAYIRRKGARPTDPYHRDNLPVLKELGQMMNRAMADRRVLVGPPKKR